jgi:tetratricopeptide (TPR) repeat protein
MALRAPRSLRVATWLILSLALCPVISAGCGGPDPRAKLMAQRIARLTPAPLKPQRAAYQEATRTARLRVYATRQYQAQNLQWREGFDRELDTINQYVAPAFGLRFVVAEYAAWNQEEDGRLETMLDALERHDPARDVDWVIGLASSLSSTTSRFHELGVARILGRHMILRGFEDLAAEPVLQEIDEAPRDWLRDARREHRQAIVFLHEWAHSLGAMHVPDTDAIMASEYTHETRTLGAETEALLEVMLQVRLAPAQGSWVESSPAMRTIIPEARALQKHLEALPARPGQEREREEMLALLATILAEAPAEEATGEVESGHHAVGEVPAEAREAYARVQALHKQGQHAQARAQLEELTAAYPAHLEFRLAACRVHLDEVGPNEAARSTCGRMAAIAPAEIDGDLMVAAALMQARRAAEAGAALTAARERIARLPAPAVGAPSPAATAWNRLFEALRALDAVTWTEQAVAAAPAGVDTTAASAWTTQLRRRFGLPPDSAKRHGIAPENEGAYLAAVRDALALVYRGELDAAERAARQALVTYRNAPGPHGVLCDLELRRKRATNARAHCQKALAIYDQASWSHYLMGILELQARKNASGIRHLERAIELDPELRQAYHALHQAHGRAQGAASRTAQERLEQDYRQRFGQPMPR